MSNQNLRADPGHCGNCGRKVASTDYMTEVNPPGGFGREQLLVCDACIASEDWAHWRSEHWPNWPEPRKLPEHLR